MKKSRKTRQADLRFCMRQARLIVQAHRDLIPADCEFRAIEGWAAAVAVGVGVAATAASTYEASSAKDAAANVPVPKLQGYTATLATDNPYAGTQGYLGAVSQYGGAANQAAQTENNYYRQSINALAPGTTQGIVTAGKNADQELRGQIPADVIASTQRADAQAALSGGFGAASGMGQNLTARDLGLTSLNLTQMGATGLANNTKLAQSLTPYGPADALGTQQGYQTDYSNYQMFNATQKNNAAQANAGIANQNAQNQYQAQVNQALAPSPVASAAIAGAGSISSGLSSYYGAQAGNLNYYGANGQGYNTAGYYATPAAANNAYGAGAQLGYVPGRGGGYYASGNGG